MTSTTSPLLWQQNLRMNGFPMPTTLPIGVVPPLVNQQQSIFQQRLPLNGMQWHLGSPQKNILLSPNTPSVFRHGMQLPGLEQPKPTNSANGKNDEENLPLEEREKLKIKREKNALASRKCRQNKIKQIQHWETQAKIIAQKLNAKEMELRLLKAKHQALLLHLQKTGFPIPPQFASDLLPTSPETSVEETPSMIQPNHVIRTDESHANTQLANSLPNINTAIQLSTLPSTDQVALVSFAEHNKTVQGLMGTVLASGVPVNYETQIYAVNSPGDQQSTPTSSTLTSSSFPSSSLTSSTLPSTLTSPTQATRILSSPPPNSDSTMQVDVVVEENDNDEEKSPPRGDFSDRPDELRLENTNPMVLGMRTTLLTPTLCMTVDTSSQRALYNQPTGLTPVVPVVTTKIIFSPNSLPLLGNSPTLLDFLGRN